VQPEGRSAVLRVQDSGIGMAPELVPRVFDLFVRGDAAAARAGGGLGVGLALVRRLVERHHGTVQAFSEGPGCGSTFTVRLAAAPSPNAQPAGDTLPSAVVAFTGTTPERNLN
jgi:two-component system CheB/CheR fusion protein